MIEEDPNIRYDKQRCRCCGHNWAPFKDEEGRIYRGHPPNDTCYRYRPESKDAEAMFQKMLADHRLSMDDVKAGETDADAASFGYVHAEIVHANGETHS